MNISPKRIIEERGGDIYISGIRTLSLPDTLDCGQAFRWEAEADGGWRGVVGQRIAHIRLEDGRLIIRNSNAKEYETLWKDYFDLGRDYTEIISAVSSNDTLKKATEVCPGIRVLKQEPWEALCSFIISQNNNIKRIKGIIERLCTTFGQELGEGLYSFPSAASISNLSVEDLAPLRAGFRAKYIIDAAQKVASGQIDLGAVATMPYIEAQAKLMEIKGVGAKVADCTLLFGFGMVEAFPKDVWIKRAMETLFPQGLPEEAKPYAGIVQQYIFHYARTVGI